MNYSKSKAIPDFLIVGAAKSGTTSLHYYLSQHPQICMPEKHKELSFWHLYNHKDERAIFKRWPFLPTTYESYTSYFEHKIEGQITGEATPSYLIYYRDTIENIKKWHPNPEQLKIIIILREPLDKIWSHYKFIRMKKLDPDNLGLEGMLKVENKRRHNFELLPDLFLLENTKYYEAVSAYMNAFTHVKILLFDELKSDAQLTLNQLFDFLNIERLSIANREIRNASRAIKSNERLIGRLKSIGFKSLLPKKLKHTILLKLKNSGKEEKMSKKTRNYLVEIFKPEVIKLQALIKKDLSNWLKNYD